MKLNRRQTSTHVYTTVLGIILLVACGIIGCKKFHSDLKKQESIHVSGTGDIVVARTFEEQKRLRTLPPIDARYSNIVKDNAHVYNLTVYQSIPEADPATFEIINGSYAKDKNHYYGYDEE